MQVQSRATILVAGVSVLDFIFRLTALPRQAEKYRASDAIVSGGGGGANAAVAVVRLGGRAVLASRLGDDVVGRLILDDLEREGVDCGLTRQFPGRRSSFSSVFVTDAGDRQIVNYRDIDAQDSAEWIADNRYSAIDAVLADTRWPRGALAAMELARQRGIAGILDAEAPVQEAAAALKLASHVAFSAQGLADLSGSSDIEAGLRKAAADLPAWVCVTDGENGAYWLDGNRLHHAPAYRVDALDTLAAGDTWHGAFALRLGEGATAPEAVRFAHAAAAIKCTRFGGRNGAPRRDEVEEFIATRALKCE